MDKENELLLAPEEIGDNLDLDVEATYPRSDGSKVMTVSVDRLLKAQLAKAKPIMGKEAFNKIRKASRGEPTAFDWALDALEIQWLYEVGRHKHRLDRPTIPNVLTNNIGCMGKAQIEEFAGMVLKGCGYPHRMEWTTAGDILIGEIIYVDERHIGEYPYMAKERVLHEVAHIDTHPQDDRHGELFHSRLAELIEQFMGRSSYYG